MDKQKQLDGIAHAIEKCQECKKEKIGMAVPGEGNPDADIMFLGEAPGKQEAKTGRPFIGRSGKLLRQMITEAGLSEDQVYITSPVKYLPERGTPTKDDIVHGNTHLDKQIAVIQPKIIVLLGKTACYSRLNEDIPVAKDHGKIVERDGLTYFISYHPAAAIRFRKNYAIFIADFRKLKLFLDERN